MRGFGVQRRNDQHRVLAPDQQQAQKTFMRVAGKARQIVHMLGIGYEQGIQLTGCHVLLQLLQSCIHFISSPFVYTLEQQCSYYNSYKWMLHLLLSLQPQSFEEEKHRVIVATIRI